MSFLLEPALAGFLRIADSAKISASMMMDRLSTAPEGFSKAGYENKDLWRP
jgi:hypothetical protein